MRLSVRALLVSCDSRGVSCACVKGKVHGSRGQLCKYYPGSRATLQQPGALYGIINTTAFPDLYQYNILGLRTLQGRAWKGKLLRLARINKVKSKRPSYRVDIRRGASKKDTLREYLYRMLSEQCWMITPFIFHYTSLELYCSFVLVSLSLVPYQVV